MEHYGWYRVWIRLLDTDAKIFNCYIHNPDDLPVSAVIGYMQYMREGRGYYGLVPVRVFIILTPTGNTLNIILTKRLWRMVSEPFTVMVIIFCWEC